ncbi:MAG: hydroxyisourate hydrolase [Pseudomonadota bacterium]
MNRGAHGDAGGFDTCGRRDAGRAGARHAGRGLRAGAGAPAHRRGLAVAQRDVRSRHRDRAAPRRSYEVVFHAGEFFTAAGVAQSSPPFLTEVPFRFTIADPQQHYHLPMKLTPWASRCFAAAERRPSISGRAAPSPRDR